MLQLTLANHEKRVPPEIHKKTNFLHKIHQKLVPTNLKDTTVYSKGGDKMMWYSFFKTPTIYSRDIILPFLFVLEHFLQIVDSKQTNGIINFY